MRSIEVDYMAAAGRLINVSYNLMFTCDNRFSDANYK